MREKIVSQSHPPPKQENLLASLRTLVFHETQLGNTAWEIKMNEAVITDGLSTHSEVGGLCPNTQRNLILWGLCGGTCYRRRLVLTERGQVTASPEEPKFEVRPIPAPHVAFLRLSFVTCKVCRPAPPWLLTPRFRPLSGMKKRKLLAMPMSTKRICTGPSKGCPPSPWDVLDGSGEGAAGPGRPLPGDPRGSSKEPT